MKHRLVSRRGPTLGPWGTFAVGAVVAIVAAAFVTWMLIRPGASAPSADSRASVPISTSRAGGTTGAAAPGSSQAGTTASAPGSGKPGSAAASASPAGCPTFSACGFPDASNTGPGSTSLSSHSGNLELRDDGQVIDGWDLTGSVDIYANNVTIEYSTINSSNWWAVNLRPGYTGLKILHTKLTGTPGAGPDNGGEDYAVSNMGDGDIEVGWDDVSVFGNALSMGNGLIHDSYVHDPAPFITRSGSYEHIDAVISDGDDTLGLTIKHNTLLNPVPIDKGPTSAIGLLSNTGPIQNTTVEDNWIAGGAYALYGGGTGSSNVKVTGNVFSTQYWPQCGYYGPVAYWNAGGSGNMWADNEFSSGAPVAAPTPD